MSSVPIKAALKHAAAWGIVVGFVSLLTIIFSFLGTLFCAALGGMMMGASKAHKAGIVLNREMPKSHQGSGTHSTCTVMAIPACILLMVS